MSAHSVLLPSPPHTRPAVREPATARPDSSDWLNLARGWLFEHLHAAVLVADLGTDRVEPVKPAAHRLFGSSPLPSRSPSRPRA